VPAALVRADRGQAHPRVRYQAQAPGFGVFWPATGRCCRWPRAGAVRRSSCASWAPIPPHAWCPPAVPRARQPVPRDRRQAV